MINSHLLAAVPNAVTDICLAKGAERAMEDTWEQEAGVNLQQRLLNSYFAFDLSTLNATMSQGPSLPHPARGPGALRQTPPLVSFFCHLKGPHKTALSLSHCKFSLFQALQNPWLYQRHNCCDARVSEQLCPNTANQNFQARTVLNVPLGLWFR